MRHYPGVKPLLYLPLVFAICLWGDETAARAEIDRVIAATNQWPPAPWTFHERFGGPCGFFIEDLEGKAAAPTRILSSKSGTPTVVISP